MFATTILSPAIQRISNVVYAWLQKFLMAAGLVFVMGLVGLQTGHLGPFEGLRSMMPSAVASVNEEVPAELPVETQAETQLVSLSPRMSGALASPPMPCSQFSLRPRRSAANCISILC
jgi:hypothetical protein